MGYRLFRFVLAIAGMLAGSAAVGATAIELGAGQVVVFVAGLLGGLLGSWLSVHVYRIGVFFVGAWFGSLLGATMAAAMGSNGNVVLVAVPAVLFGIVAVFLQRHMIILSTAFCGACAVVLAVLYVLMGWEGLPELGMLLLQPPKTLAITAACWAALGLTGAIMQYGSKG